MVRFFEGTHVAITGGGSGIGLELARQFVRHGAVSVSLLDISDCTSIIADLLAESAGSCSVKCYRTNVTEYQQARFHTESDKLPRWATDSRQYSLSDTLRLAGSAGPSQRGAAAGALH